MKFRIWNKTREAFFYYDFEKDDIAILVEVKENRDNYVIQKFTGVKDRLGNPIYEGDVLTDSYFSPLDGSTKFEDFFIVDCGSSFFRVSSLTRDNYKPPLWIHYMECVVIGNIFEDKNLNRLIHYFNLDHNIECPMCSMLEVELNIPHVIRKIDDVNDTRLNLKYDENYMYCLNCQFEFVTPEQEKLNMWAIKMQGMLEEN